jgi:DNA-binding transcriptional LysR family regulator
VQVRFVDTPSDLERQLAQGALDLCVTDVRNLGWKVISAAQSCRDRLVGVVDKAHPLARLKRIKKSDLAEYSTLEWELGFRQMRPAVAASLKALQNSKARIYLHSSCALPVAVLGTDMVITVPGVLARRMAADLPLRIFELPFAPIVVESSIVWSSAQDSDPAHRWFRELVHSVLTDVHATA